MCRCVRGSYGDLIFWREVAGAFVAADRIDACRQRRAVDLFCAAFFGLCRVIRQSIQGF
jgi:hypothetical protein